MLERQSPILYDAGMCQQHGNFLPCVVCGEQKNENTLEIDQESFEDRELIELLQKECMSPVSGSEEMPIIAYEKIMKENGIELESNFVDDVLIFETKLAYINMKQDQARHYDKYYTNTTLENFYKYAYLYSLKSLFNPEDAWLYGNLSPLVDMKEVERDKELYVSYAIKTNRIFREIKNSIPEKIAKFYNVKIDNVNDVDRVEKIIKNRLGKLV